MTPAAFAIPGDIATRTGGYIYERRLLESLRAQGRRVDYLALPAGFPDPTPGAISKSLEMLEKVREDTPLILDGFLSGTLPTQGLAALRSPLCAVVHHPLGLESGLTPDRAAFLIERETANLALMRHILVPSPHTARILLSDFNILPDRITVSPPGFDPVITPRQPADPPLILAVGILHPRKGHNILLEALANIADLPWQAAIVGGTHDPAHAATLHARAAEPDLRDRVHLTGELDAPELEKLYRSATLLALATRYEGYGMVFGEAQRHGLPIVSTRAGAVPDTVPPEAGLLVPPDDSPAFAAALRKILTNKELYASIAQGSAGAGRALPTWQDTAKIAGAVLDSMSIH